MQAVAGERRLSPRDPAVANGARLEWWEGDTSRDTAARLVDISEGGALVVADVPPPLAQAVWLRVVDPAPTDWVKATVVRHGGPHEAGLAFADRCPADLYMAATLGINPVGLLGEVVLSDADPCDRW
jgi:hypothetical protein